ncbi:uncharacterized protein J3D65DRAFT_615854 [Phyllosticta citribraziliensis]|uniref:Uncharacterized protein n=1 Tax=Phyllosticta citribraziliensis TaxID=989973 RepID=A0ABR1LZG3_9PEZI
MPTTTTVVSIIAGIVAALSAYIYFFGIPPAIRRELEQKALKTMGENKASYLVKDQISKMPASDQEDIKNIRNGVGNLAGGSLNNPLGETAGNAADDITSPFTGR